MNLAPAYWPSNKQAADWQCPCGCALKLDRRQIAIENWASDLAGQETGARVSLTTNGLSRFAEKPEPESEQPCTGCGKRFSLATWLVEWCLSYGVRLRCEACR